MALKRIEDFIKIYDNAFSESYCKELISWFENSEQKFIDHEEKPRFYESGLDEFGTRKCIETVNPFMLKYVDQVNSDKWFPNNYTYEYARVKKYHKNSRDRFGPHVDVTDHQSAKRVLSFLVYLNDVSSGGETHFLHTKTWIKPKMGRMVIFPPLWMFPHEGRPTYSNDKYILSTYLHYL